MSKTAYRPRTRADYWQPIDDAPADLTRVWLWFAELERAIEGETFHYTNGSVGVVCPAARGAKASFWMPLPRPPILPKGHKP